MHFAGKTDPGSTTGSNTVTDEEMLVQSEILGEPVVLAELSGRPITYGLNGRGENSEAEPKTTSQLAGSSRPKKSLKENVRTLWREPETAVNQESRALSRKVVIRV